MVPSGMNHPKIVLIHFITLIRSIFDIGREDKREWLGAGHAEDLPLVFGWPFIDIMRIYAGFDLTPEEKDLSVKVMRFWTNFAKSGYVNILDTKSYVCTAHSTGRKLKQTRDNCA